MLLFFENKCFILVLNRDDMACKQGAVNPSDRPDALEPERGMLICASSLLEVVFRGSRVINRRKDTL